MLIGAVLVAALAGCGSSSPKTPSLGAAPAVSGATAKTWPAKWCQAQPGITRAQLEQIMGTPTQVDPEGESWSAYEFQFNAFFAADGTVRQLDINDLELTAAEKASLACQTTRIAS